MFLYFMIERMNISQILQSTAESLPSLSLSDVCASGPIKPTPPVPSNPAEFHDISPNPTPFVAQHVDHQSVVRKQALGTFAQKISSEQRTQLFHWLADHTYEEVIELVAAEPPDGFGMKVAKSTVCRFYKAHFHEIDRIRQDHIEERGAEQLHRQDGHDYRSILRDSYTQLLLERLWELLSRPVQSADELKKLTVIAEKMKSLDRDRDMIEEERAEKRKGEVDQILSAFRSRPDPTT